LKLLPVRSELRVTYITLLYDKSLYLLGFVVVDGIACNSSKTTYILPSSQELEEKLSGYLNVASSILPRHMVPSSLVPINKIPITANGKVDRRSLKGMAEKLPRIVLLSQHKTLNRATEPLTSTEVILAKCWNNVLGRDGPITSREDGRKMKSVELVGYLPSDFIPL
jgi:hypothetical protein